MSESFAPGTHCFSTVKHKVTVKAALSTDHSRGSRNKDCVAIIFGMVTVVYVSMASRHRVLSAGVLVSLLESSSSTTIRLWNEPTGARRIEGPELFEE